MKTWLPSRALSEALRAPHCSRLWVRLGLKGLELAACRDNEGARLGMLGAVGKTENGFTPLLWASQNGHSDGARLGMLGAVDKTENGFTPLLWASQKGHSNVARELLGLGDRPASSRE